MGRARFSVEGEQIQTADPTQYGGHVQKETRHDGGPNTLDEAPQDEVGRFRGMGEAAAQRQAYQADFSKALGDEKRGIDMRGQQDAGLRYMRQAAMGNAPSQAAILGNAAAGQSLQAQLGASSGARGMGQAAAQMQAQNAMGGQQLGAVGQYAGMRGSEMAHAQSAFGTGANQMRGGDYTQQGMAQQRAEAQAHSELTQRQLNQGAQMGYEQMGINVQQNDVDSALRNAAIQNQKNADMQASHDARNARNMKVYTATANAIGTTAGDSSLGDQTTMGAANSDPNKTGSDERMKQGVAPMSMLSDDRTKLAQAWREGVNHASTAAETGKFGEVPDYVHEPSVVKHQPAAKDSKAASTTVNKADGTGQRNAVKASSQDMARAAIMTNPVMPPSVYLGGDLMKASVEGRSLGQQRANQAPARLPALARTRDMQAFARESPDPRADNQTMRTDAVYERQPDGAMEQTFSDERTKTNEHAEGDMGRHLEEGFKPFEYEYKPGFAEHEGQQLGEKNVGPMAQDMAKNAVTGSAVEKRADGLLQISIPKVTKVNSAGIGYLAARMRKQDEEIARLKGGR